MAYYGQFDSIQVQHNLKVDGNSAITGTLSVDGYTLTVPATGTAALLGTENVFTAAQTLGTTTKLHPRDAAIGIYSQADTFLDFFADGGMRFGDSSAGAPTNYLNISPTGVVTLAGAARTRNSVDISFAGLRAPGTKPATFVDHGIAGAWEFSDDADDTIIAQGRIPRRADISVAVSLAFKWSSPATSKVCKWQLEYLWRAGDEDMTVAAQETLTITPTSSANANGLVVSELTGIDLPSDTDNLIKMRIKRLGADAADTLSDVANLTGISLRFTSNKLGTAL